LSPRYRSIYFSSALRSLNEISFPNLAAILGHSVDVLSRHYAAAMPAPTDPRIDPERAVVEARCKIKKELDET
jgi:hypothetical protein